MARPWFASIQTPLIGALLVASGAAAGQQAVTGSATPCERNAILAPGGGAATLVVCPGVDRAVPELKAQVVRLQSLLASRDEETRRDVESLRTALNALSRQLKPTDAETLARTLAARLAASAGVPDGRFAAELSRLRVDLREVNEKIEGLRAAPTTAARADAELQGATGTALAQMDFAQANTMLDSLARVEGKIDAMSRDIRDLVNPADAAAVVASDRRMAEDAWQRFRAADGQRRCPLLHEELSRVMLGSREAESAGRYVAARNLLLTAMSRSGQAVAELMSFDRHAQARRDGYDHARAGLDYAIRETERELARLQDDRDKRERDRDRVRSERAELMNANLRRADAAIEEWRARVARERTELAAARALPAGSETEASRRMILVRQKESTLALAEKGLQDATSNRQRLIEGADRAGANLAASGSDDQRTLVQRRAGEARARLLAARDEAAGLEAAGQLDLATDAIRRAEHEARALRHGREASPQPERASGTGRSPTVQACR